MVSNTDERIIDSKVDVVMFRILGLKLGAVYRNSYKNHTHFYKELGSELKIKKREIC